MLVIRIEHKRNAIDRAIAEGIDAALDGERGLRAGLLTGSATIFSAGTDLRSGREARTRSAVSTA